MLERNGSSLRAQRRRKVIIHGLLALGGAGFAWTLFAINVGAPARPPAAPSSALQVLDDRQSGGTWMVRGVLQEEQRLQLLRSGIRCYQFDSRSW